MDGTESPRGWVTITVLIFFMNRVLLILTILYISCVKNKYPDTVPPDAKFDKKTSSFILVKDGVRKVWNESGELFSEESLDNLGRNNGAYRSYFPSSGALLSRGSYKDGEREGIWEWYFPDGKIYYKSGYSPDRKRQVWIETNLLGNEHGIHERYYPNGQIEEKGTFEYGLKIGEWEKYYKNGKLEHRGFYRADKKIGEWVYLYHDGKSAVNELFDGDGKLISRSTFYPNGELECKISPPKNVECNKL